MGILCSLETSVQGSDATSNVCRHATESSELMRWMLTRIDDLLKNPNGENQIEYINKQLFSSIKRYKTNVETSLNSRREKLTWSHKDTLHLP